MIRRIATKIAMETFILRAGSLTLPRGGTFNLCICSTGEIDKERFAYKQNKYDIIILRQRGGGTA